MEKLYKEILEYCSIQYHHNTKQGMERLIKDFFIWNHDKIFKSRNDVIYFGIYAGKPLHLNKESIASMSNCGLYPNFNYVFSVHCENDSIIINQLTEHNLDNLDRCLTACVLKLQQFYK